MKNKIIDIISLSIVALLFGGVVVLNLFQTDRPTESETEKRELHTMPEFTASSLLDGSYFSKLSLFISDTFIGRDKLVEASKKLDTLTGIEYSFDGEGNFVILDGTQGKTEENTDAAQKIDEAFANLESNLAQTETETEGAKDTVHASGEIVDEETDKTEESEESSTEESESESESVKVTAIYLSKQSVKLTVGSGTVVYATVDSENHKTVNVNWSVSNKNVATISVNPEGGINVKAVAPGTCTLTCSYGEDLVEKCEITVTEIATNPNAEYSSDADFLTNGLFIYGDAVYTQAFYSETNSRYYAQTAEYYKKLFGDKTRVSVVVAPVSSMVIDDPKITAKIPDQKGIIDKMGNLMSDSVNFVDAYSEMYDHRDEYLFFKSDHHWTARGAYYAYAAFAKSVGLDPVPLDRFDFEIRNEDYHGSLYSFTLDERVKSFKDVVEAFHPSKKHTMTITSANGAVYSYDTSIVKTNNTYVTFIAGDNPHTVINVPENPQDKNILVLKDSFGNAFVPYLCEHYGNIIVVDVRYSTFNIYELLADYGLTDIVFVNNIQAANTFSWARDYMKAVGVSIN